MSQQSSYPAKTAPVGADKVLIADSEATWATKNVPFSAFEPANAAIIMTIATGAQALGVLEIADNACAALITVSATGVLTTDIVDIGYNSTPVGKTGYDPTAAELSIRAFPTADNINILVCNRTGAAVTPAAMTINWRVVR